MSRMHMDQMPEDGGWTTQIEKEKKDIITRQKKEDKTTTEKIEREKQQSTESKQQKDN